MRVLGVDPGLTRCGLGVVEGLSGHRARMIAVGVIRTSATDEPQERLLTLQTELDQWFAEHRPDAVAIERVFARANIRGIIGTAQASAVPLLAAARAGLPVGTYTPTEVKAAVTGHGGAHKAQVTAMITRILRLDTPPRPADAADALALAVCHVWRGGAGDRLRVAAGSPARNRLQELHAAAATRTRSGAR